MSKGGPHEAVVLPAVALFFRLGPGVEERSCDGRVYGRVCRSLGVVFKMTAWDVFAMIGVVLVVFLGCAFVYLGLQMYGSKK